MDLLTQLGLGRLLEQDTRQQAYLECFRSWHDSMRSGESYRRAHDSLQKIPIPENLYSIYTTLALDSREGLPFYEEIGYYLAAAFNCSGKPVQYVRDIGRSLEGLGSYLEPGKTLIVDADTTLLGDHASGGKIINRGTMFSGGMEKKDMVFENHGHVHRLSDLVCSLFINHGRVDMVADVHGNLLIDQVGTMRAYVDCSDNVIVESAPVSVRLESFRFLDENLCIGEQFWDIGGYNLHRHSGDSRIKNALACISHIAQERKDDLAVFEELRSRFGGASPKEAIARMKRVLEEMTSDLL